MRAMPILASVLFVAIAMADAPPPADEDLLAVGPQDLRRYWTREPLSLADVVAARDLPRGSIGCAAVGFIIERDGSTSSFRLLRDMPPETFGALARKVVASLKFAPTAANVEHQPVFTYLTISFRAPDADVSGKRRAAPVSLDDRLNTLCAVKGLN